MQHALRSTDSSITPTATHATARRTAGTDGRPASAGARAIDRMAACSQRRPCAMWPVSAHRQQEKSARDHLDMGETVPLRRLRKQLMDILKSGDVQEMNRILGGVDVATIAEAFADLLDGIVNPAPVVGRFVSACWADRRQNADRRRHRGLMIPGAIRDVPGAPGDRRRYLRQSFDTVAPAEVGLLLILAAARADPAARAHASERLVQAMVVLGQDQDATSAQVAEQALRALRVLTPLDRLQAARHLEGALEVEINRAVADARTSGVTWREIGEALSIPAGTARRRFAK